MGPFDAVHPALLVLIILVPAAVKLLRVRIAHRTTVRVEEEHTRRVRVCLEGSGALRRPEVVRACAELEAASSPRYVPAARSRRRTPP